MPRAVRPDLGRPPDCEPYDPAAYVEAVLDLVEQIPPGRVMSYGAIAECLHDRFGRGSARRVGTIMAQYGGPVPWHRVVSGGGRLPPGYEVEARRRLEPEGVRFTGGRVRMAEHAWWPAAAAPPQDRRDHEVGSLVQNPRLHAS